MQVQHIALAMRPWHRAVKGREGVVLGPAGLRRQGPDPQEVVRGACDETRLGPVEGKGPDLYLVFSYGLKADLQFDGPNLYETVLGCADET
eukprot:CAMPEP_0197931790 /NCGR_PEP_ID=MMETSP1439-20131203/107618_1 /TAXON_ID=66791 /ORGANISM="Gonyaulax spinifera, Strain CCMP409" /LENGTH=90 /DNA_ID=CAMNT_0043554543 /DNA_START=214 /DNA_END=483 /DNA_ORIENTATION=-